MNDHHLMILADDIVATRRAEADRARLARTSHAPSTTGRPAKPVRRQRRASATLSALFGRVALY